MKLIFGCGYLGRRVARLWREQGDDVTVATRSAAKAEALRSEGYAAVTADVCDPTTLVDLPPAETVLFAVGYDRNAATGTIGEVYAGGMQNVLKALTAASIAPLIVYISSTGVYGDADGDWVDESTVCKPLREGGAASLAAEQAIANHPLGKRAVVLRLAGIYGPGRVPRADAIRRGEPIDAPASGYLNLIHVDDAAAVVLEVERRAGDGRIALPRTYNVADGRPGLRREYYGELARLLGGPPPKFVEAPTSSPAAARAAADKRISNRRLLDEVAPTLKYPSFREGLAAIVSHKEA